VHHDFKFQEDAKIDFFKICLQISYIFPAFLCALVHQSHGEYNNTDIVIMPLSHTSRGAIGAGRICPQNEFAIGYRLKMHNQVISDLKSISKTCFYTYCTFKVLLQDFPNEDFPNEVLRNTNSQK